MRAIQTPAAALPPAGAAAAPGARPARRARQRSIRAAADGVNGQASAERAEPSYSDQESLVDVGAILRDHRGDVLAADSDNEEVWEHEGRFIREPPPREAPQVHIRGALDPDQADPERADILSAYSPEQGFQETSVDELAASLAAGAPPLLIDVRTAEEFAAGHVRGARNLSLEGLSAAVRAGELRREAPVAVICARGRRSAQACVRLSKVFSFAAVSNVRGGMAAWQDAGLPVHPA